jgi:hypothetical protein
MRLPSPNDSSGPRPPETMEQPSRRAKMDPKPQPIMRSLDLATPASGSVLSNVGNTSARATQGCNSTRCINSSGLSRQSRPQEPRKLNLSPASHKELTELQPDDPQLLILPSSLFPHWCISMMCSALSLAAAAAGTPLTTSSLDSETSYETGNYENLQMVMAISTLSLMLTFLACSSYVLIPASFVGSLYEVTVVST